MDNNCIFLAAVYFTSVRNVCASKDEVCGIVNRLRTVKEHGHGQHWKHQRQVTVAQTSQL